MLELGEGRESRGIGFLCASPEGWRAILEAVRGRGLDGLLTPGAAPPALRDLRSDRFGVRTILEVEGAAIGFEINREGLRASFRHLARVAITEAACAESPAARAIAAFGIGTFRRSRVTMRLRMRAPAPSAAPARAAPSRALLSSDVPVSQPGGAG